MIMEASHVYLLMKNEFRISRNARASWYLRQLNIPTDFAPKADGTPTSELEVLSVRTKTGDHDLQPNDSSENRPTFKVTTATKLTFLAKCYRLVFVLDVSPSSAAVDQLDGVLFEEMYRSLNDTLTGLIKPFYAPGSTQLLTPQIYITVIAHSALINCNANQVLIQGCLLSADTVTTILDNVRRQLERFESNCASCMSDIIVGCDLDDEDDQRLTGGLFEDILERPESPDPSLHVVSPDVGFINMLRYGILALQLLPENSSAGIVVITDGMVGLPDAMLFESLMTHLRHNTIACSFLQVGNGFQTTAGLGQLPYTELLQFLATATFGAYLTRHPKIDDHGDGKMNMYHQALLTWGFQKGLDGEKMDIALTNSFEQLNEDLAWSSRISCQDLGSQKTLWVTPLMKKKHAERNLQTTITNLISCRLREGYTIRDVTITKGESQIEVKLVLPWRDNVWIHYIAVSAWPITSAKRHTHIEVSIEGSYDFLHDVTCPRKKPFKSPFRAAVVKKYWQTLQGMSQTDQLLVHLQSFTSNNAYFNVPESLKKGVPLFFLAPESETPQLNIQLSAKDAALSQFSSFWKPVLMLDINIWQKWMHTHRIGVILEHDMPLGKHLHIPNSSGRFHSITCRQALTALNFFLRDWSTFILMENHSYIKILSNEPEKTPLSFCVIRVASKPPCVVLRLAFLGGTSGGHRLEMVEQLRDKIWCLNFPQRGIQKDEKAKKLTKKHSVEDKELTPSHRPPLQRLWSEIPCCILTQKPIEKILIKYDKVPLDYLHFDLSPVDQSGRMDPLTKANQVASRLFSTLARYLYHQRWVWSIQPAASRHGSVMSISMQAIGRIMANLTKIRLQEGFHFANASSGIVNMVVELEMKPHCTESDVPESEMPAGGSTVKAEEDTFPCVFQYIVFPPHITTTRENVSEDELEELETTEADGELQIITECWVEPQDGIIVNSSPERKHLDGLNYKQLPHYIFPTDLECISTMITFEHLNLMCHDPTTAISGGAPTPSFSFLSSGNVTPGRGDASVQQVPFAFDLMQLLPKCQQVELLFSTFQLDMSSLPRMRPRSDTITSQSNCWGPKDDRSIDDSSNPNTLLFSIFLENLETIHDREIHLTEMECEQLVQLVQDRSRDPDEHPLPFKYQTGAAAYLEHQKDESESTISLSTTVSITSATSQSKSSFALARSMSVSAPPASQTPVSRERLKSWEGGALGATVSNPEQLQNRPQGLIKQNIVDPVQEEVKESPTYEASRVTPRWRCFIKSMTATHIVICFVPASFDDLRLLVQGQSVFDFKFGDELKEKPKETKEVVTADGVDQDSSKFESVDGVEHVKVVQSDSSSGVSQGGQKLTTTTADTSDLKPTKAESTVEEVSIVQNEGIASEDLEHQDCKPEADQGEVLPLKEPERAVSSEEHQVEQGSDIATAAPKAVKDSGEIDDAYQTLPLPVYVYDCPLSTLTDQLVNKWTYSRPQDIYEDLRFHEEAVEPKVVEKEGEELVHETEESVADTTRRKRNDSDLMRERLRFAKEETSVADGIYGKQEELKQRSTLISEHFFRCFVTGVFRSLQMGHCIVSQDVDASINGICEESLPVEMDVTRFVHSICGHVHQVVERAFLERMFQQDIQATLPRPADYPSREDSQEGSTKGSGKEDLSRQGSRSPHSPSACPAAEHSRQDSRTLLKFPLALLQGDSTCESYPGLHVLVANKFTGIVENFFKPVASNLDYFFYCPPDLPDRLGDLTSLEQGVSGNSQLADISDDVKGGADTEDDGSGIFVMDQDTEHDAKASDRDSVTSIKDSSSFASLRGEDLDLGEVEDEAVDGPPLFIHLTCSVRTSGSVLKSIPMRNLPTCMGELKSCLGDLSGEINLNDMQITLDVICLTLPPDPDLEEPMSRPAYNRMMSSSSAYTYMSTSPTESEAPSEPASMATTTEVGLLKSSLEPLKALPNYQQEAMKQVQIQVSWLLRDEIASAMRQIVPVTHSTLEMVANHVKCSVDKPTCIWEEVLLNFVYGPEQSRPHFIEAFERLDLPGYHLNKEGQYYYLSMDRLHADTYARAQAISSALESLGDQSPQTDHLLRLEPYVEVGNNESALSPQDQPPVSPSPDLGSPDPLSSSPKLGSADKSSQSAQQSSSMPAPTDVHMPKIGDEGIPVASASAQSKDIAGKAVMSEAMNASAADPSSIAEHSKQASPSQEHSGLKRQDAIEGGQSQDLEEGAMQDSVEILEDDKPLEDSQQSSELEIKHDHFCAEDIKISVIRPSPVKEARPPLQDLAIPQRLGGSPGSSGAVGPEDDDIEILEKHVQPEQPKSPKDVKFKGQVEGEESQSAKESDKIKSAKSKAGSGESAERLVLQKAVSEQTQRLDSKEGETDIRRLSGQLSPLAISDPAFVKHNMKRAHSSASFEKYKHEKHGKSGGQVTPSRSGHATPKRRPSGNHTPVRSRHQSGLQTPISSVLDTSSSVGEEGYDGGSSDSDEEGVMMSFNESMVRKPLLPDFWLIMRIFSDRVYVYFHTRDLGEDTDEYNLHVSLYNQVTNNITAICRLVNQRLLLEDLFNTRTCSTLLVPQADEDFKWKVDRIYPTHHRRKTDDSDESDKDEHEDRYLADTMQLMPGHFACESVWQEEFVMHPRLKTGPGRTGVSRVGIQTLRSALSTFAVVNRKNMFVIKSNGNVFYLRLEERHSPGKPGNYPAPENYGNFASIGFRPDEDTVTSLMTSRSSSMWSLPARRHDTEEDSGYLASRQVSMNEDETSLASSRLSRKPEDSGILSAYGIASISEGSKQDLVQMLQKRLDEAVLDVVTVMLARNPMCKLMPEDVLFIQPPPVSPREVVRLTIPATAMLQQFALGYYLRQNLLQFLFIPKYADNRPENVFKNYMNPKAPAIPENSVFLYNRPQQAGGKGIACIHLSFVDGKGNPIQLISSPKPSPHAYRDSFDRSMFDNMVSTTLYKVTPESKSPGPTALVQFTIWERGDVDMRQLTEKLLRAMKHAICDIVMEYRLLTAPLCEPPVHYSHGVDSPMHSAPPSPVLTQGVMQDSRSMPAHPNSKDKPMVVGGRTPKEKSASFSIQAIMSDVFKTKAVRDGSPRLDSPGPGGIAGSGLSAQVMQELDGQRRKEAELRQKMHQYEAGDRGALHPLFASTLLDWLEYCTHIGMPSVQKFEFSLHSRFAMEYVLKDTQSIINNLMGDAHTSKVFKMTSSGSNDTEISYVPYVPSRAPCTMNYDSKSESSLDLAQLCTGQTPGRASFFIVIGRNVHQWRASIDYIDVDEEVVQYLPPASCDKARKTHQRFMPLEPHSSGEKSDLAPPLPFVVDSFRAFVPRQRHLVMTVRDKEFLVYVYNWASEVVSSLERQVARLLQWHNARTHLLSCILSQKMGLFQHTIFGDLMPDPGSQEPNQFVQSVSDIDLLVKYTSPPMPELQKRSRSNSMVRPNHPSIHPALPFEDIYRNAKPRTPMQQSTYCSLRDPVHRHGAQMLELKKRERIWNEKRMKLEDLHVMWQQRVMGTVPIAEDVVALLKTSSRLVHSVDTPLLFSHLWRRQVLGPLDKPKRNNSQSSDSKSRSRHSSGASMRSRRSDSVDSKKRAGGVDSPDVNPRQAQEEAWHVDLRSSFLSQYIQYIQSLGFIPIRTRPPSPKRSRTRDEKKKKPDDPKLLPGVKPNYSYLQKTLPGGIMLIELGFKEVYFSIHVYALECSRLLCGKNVNPQLALIFTDECDRFKDLTHAHSFAHDFHMRTVQSYITGRQLVFKQGYHLTAFLQDFVRHFPYAPSFARNYIFEGGMAILNTSSSSHQLFDYMLNHDKHYGMRAIRMVPFADEDSELLENEYALMTRLDCEATVEDADTLKIKPEDYDVGLVITHDAPAGSRQTEAERTTLRLKYYIILTSKKDLYPKPTLERKLGVFKSATVKSYPANRSYFEPSSVEDSLPPPPVKQHIGMRQEAVNYLGFSNKHQTAVYAMLLQQSRIVRDKIEQMVDSAHLQCRRDILWQRMLLPPNVSEEEGRRKRRSEPQEEAKDPFLTRLSFPEFQELLKLVTQERLGNMDSRLMPLQNMSLPWYQALARVLMNKYTESHRHFVTPDGLVQYVVVLNPNYLDMFLLLTVDAHAHKTELCAVFREAMSDPLHTPANPNLPALAVQNHIEGFVNACCYHMWIGLL